MFAVVDEAEEPADFGEGECDQVPVDRWRGFRFGRLVAWIVECVQLFGVLVPLFLVMCVMMVRKVWASMDKVICRCQASQGKHSRAWQ